MSEQVFYNDKWHEKNQFRVYVYNKDGEKKLCNNWWEYEVLKQGGIWFDEVPAPEPTTPKRTRKKKAE